MTSPESSDVVALHDRLANVSAPLVRLRAYKGTPILASAAFPWELPLSTLHDSGGGGGGGGGGSGGGHSGHSGVGAAAAADRPIDRCFCRYVTQPHFGAAGSALFAASAQKLLGAADGGVALHLRTGFADMSDHDVLIDPSAAPANAMEARRWPSEPYATPGRWLHAACDEASLRALPAALVLSDAPGLVEYAVRAFPQLHALGRLSNPAANGSAAATPAAAAAASAAAGLRSATTRSWSNGFDAKLGAVLDATLAGLAAEVRFSRYSVMLKPAVARSVCTRRVVSFDESAAAACPHFDRVFVRNPHILTKDPHIYACVQQQLPHAHPCRGVPRAACRGAFVAAMRVPPPSAGAASSASPRGATNAAAKRAAERAL